MIWTLTMRWAGRDWVFTTELGGGLGDIEISEDVVQGSQVGYRTVPITIIVPEIDLDWPFSTATAILSNSESGDYISGRVDSAVVTVGEGPGSIVSFTLEGGPWSQTAVWPDASHVVSDDTFSAPDDAAQGKAYPQVFGSPGRGDVNGLTRYKGSPGIVVQTTGNARLMIAEGVVASTQVQVTDDDVGGWAEHSVLYDSDANGVFYAYVELTAGTTPYVVGHSYYVSWGFGNDGDSAATTARKVLVEALQRTSVGCDFGRTLSSPSLSIALDFYIDEIVDPWDWLKAHLFPILPISIYSGPKGAYPIVWRYDAEAKDAQWNLILGQNVNRSGSWEESTTRSIINEVIVQYAVDAGTGQYLRQVVVRSQRSILRYGISSQTIKTDVIWDEGAAYIAGQSVLRAKAFPSRRCTYVCYDPIKLEAGDVVTITDPDYGLYEVVALVEAPSPMGGYTSFTLLLV